MITVSFVLVAITTVLELTNYIRDTISSNAVNEMID